MSLRLSDRSGGKLNIDIPDDGRYMVAPLLFITLIENARFKHGVSPSEKSFVSIAFRITEVYTLVTIENSYFRRRHDRSGSGIASTIRVKAEPDLSEPGILRMGQRSLYACNLIINPLTMVAIESLVVDDELLARRTCQAGYVKQRRRSCILRGACSVRSKR